MNPTVGRLFEAQALERQLADVSDRGSSEKQEQFAVIFRGPLEAFLPQRLYRLEHEALGMLDLFLVPVGKDQHAYRYEAVFNRYRQCEA